MAMDQVIRFFSSCDHIVVWAGGVIYRVVGYLYTYGAFLHIQFQTHYGYWRYNCMVCTVY